MYSSSNFHPISEESLMFASSMLWISQLGDVLLSSPFKTISCKSVSYLCRTDIVFDTRVFHVVNLTTWPFLPPVSSVPLATGLGSRLPRYESHDLATFCSLPHSTP